jgi:hypothetical protein
MRGIANQPMIVLQGDATPLPVALTEHPAFSEKANE